MTTSTILLLLLSIVLAGGLSYFQYYYKAKNKSKLHLFLALLRFAVYFGILLLLINPKITSHSYEIQKTPLASYKGQKYEKAVVTKIIKDNLA